MEPNIKKYMRIMVNAKVNQLISSMQVAILRWMRNLRLLCHMMKQRNLHTENEINCFR